MRRSIQRVVALSLALLLVSATFGIAVDTGLVERDQASPVGESEAAVCGGVCILGAGIAIGIAGGAVGYKEFVADNNVDQEALAEADADEARKNIYTTSATQHQNNLILLDSYQNYLNDASSIALMEGKNAYIRALENGESEVAARIEAREAVAEYYAKKQRKLAKQWTVSAGVFQTQKAAIRNNSDVSGRFNFQSSNGDFSARSFPQRNVTLVNGETESVTGVKVQDYVSGVERTGVLTPESNRASFEIYAVKVKPPNDNYPPKTMMNFSKYVSTWERIETQNEETQDKVERFVNSTYDAHQNGTLSTEDLVDPYLSARDYSPEGQYGTWSLRSLSAMGLNPPENLSGVGTMTIRNDQTGESVDGVLLSDGVPDSGAFTVGETYNASNLGGPQLVIDRESGETRQLNGEFTLTNATTMDGNTTSTVRYRNISYETTNIEEFKQLQDELRNLTAQIESRQQRLRNPGGGGLLDGLGGSLGIGLNSAQVAIVVLLLFVLVIAAVTRS